MSDSGLASGRRLLNLVAVLVLIFATGASHGEQTDEETAGNHQLMFLPPPAEGVISLGVYDSNGKLVRILKRAAEIDSFKSGLNGLFIDWDGKDSKGVPVPAGKYSARGFLVGDVEISGEAFHFNDWVDLFDQHPIKQILSASFLSGKSICALAEIGTGKELLVDPSSSKYRGATLPADTRNVKFDGSQVLAIGENRTVRLDPITQETVEEKSYSGLRDFDQWHGKRIALTDKQIISSNENGSDKSLSPPTDNLIRCAQLDSSAVVASSDGHLWKLQDGNFMSIPTGETGDLVDLSAGKGDTIWVLLRIGSKLFLRQVDLSGQRMEEIGLPSDLQSARRVSGCRDDEDLLLTVELKPGDRVIGLHFQNSKAEQSVWQKWFDRSITPFHDFEVKDGKVVPSEAKTESTPVSIQLAANPLENGAGTVVLIVTADESGAWISTNDGLPLLQVSKTKNIADAKWTADGTNGLRVFVSDGSVVEEYRVSGLENLFRFDAGTFD
jgi:hypothetical protein